MQIASRLIPPDTPLAGAELIAFSVSNSLALCTQPHTKVGLLVLEVLYTLCHLPIVVLDDVQLVVSRNWMHHIATELSVIIFLLLCALAIHGPYSPECLIK